MGDGALQIRSKDDENINQFCLAENKNVTFSCSEISALLTIPEIPMLPEFEPCELTTELLTTELIFTTEETGTVSVSSPQRTSTGASDLTVNALTTDSVSSEDKPPPSTTPVDGGSLTGTGNPNAALIIGFSLGGLFLIVVVAILFYKFYYKPKKSRSLTVNPTSGGRPEEVNQALRIHDPDKKFLELHPPNSLQAWDEKTETKESHIKAHDVDGKSSPSALPPVASTMQGGETDITKPKNKKTKKRKRKTPEANEELPNVESPVIGNGTGAPTEVIT